MALIVLSDLPGDEPGSRLKAYEEATKSLYERCGSDRVYEDVMNGLAYLDKNDQAVYVNEPEEDGYPYSRFF